MKRSGKVLGLAMAVLIGSVTVSCGGDEGDAGMGPAGGGDVVLIEITSPSTTVSVGSTLQLTATAKNADGGTVSGKTFTWTSGQASVATVDNTGLVAGLVAGITTITAKVDGVPGGRVITVN